MGAPASPPILIPLFFVWSKDSRTGPRTGHASAMPPGAAGATAESADARRARPRAPPPGRAEPGWIASAAFLAPRIRHLAAESAPRRDLHLRCWFAPAHWLRLLEAQPAGVD